MDARSQWRGMDTVGADAVVPPRPTWRCKLRVLRARRQARVELESGVRIGRDVLLRVAPGARLRIGAGAALGDGARLEARGGELRVGAGTMVGERAMIAGEPPYPRVSARRPADNSS